MSRQIKAQWQWNCPPKKQNTGVPYVLKFLVDKMRDSSYLTKQEGAGIRASNIDPKGAYAANKLIYHINSAYSSQSKEIDSNTFLIVLPHLLQRDSELACKYRKEYLKGLKLGNLITSKDSDAFVALTSEQEKLSFVKDTVVSRWSEFETSVVHYLANMAKEASNEKTKMEIESIAKLELPRLAYESETQLTKINGLTKLLTFIFTNKDSIFTKPLVYEDEENCWKDYSKEDSDSIEEAYSLGTPKEVTLTPTSAGNYIVVPSLARQEKAGERTRRRAIRRKVVSGQLNVEKFYVLSDLVQTSCEYCQIGKASVDLFVAPKPVDAIILPYPIPSFIQCSTLGLNFDENRLKEIAKNAKDDVTVPYDVIGPVLVGQVQFVFVNFIEGRDQASFAVRAALGVLPDSVKSVLITNFVKDVNEDYAISVSEGISYYYSIDTILLTRRTRWNDIFG